MGQAAPKLVLVCKLVSLLTHVVIARWTLVIEDRNARQQLIVDVVHVKTSLNSIHFRSSTLWGIKFGDAFMSVNGVIIIHNEVVGGVYWYHLVRPSVRSASRVRSVVPTVLVGSISYLYPPYPKDRGMLWFYVEAARRPPPAARNGVNAITQKPRDGLFSNLVYTLVVIVSWPD